MRDVWYGGIPCEVCASIIASNGGLSAVRVATARCSLSAVAAGASGRAAACWQSDRQDPQRLQFAPRSKQGTPGSRVLSLHRLTVRRLRLCRVLSVHRMRLCRVLSVHRLGLCRVLPFHRLFIYLYSICSEAHCPFNVIRCSAKGRRWLKASWVLTWRLQRRLLLGLCSVGAQLDQLRVGVYTVASVRYKCSEWEVDTYHPSDERCSTLHPSSHPANDCNHANCACLHTNCRITAPSLPALRALLTSHRSNALTHTFSAARLLMREGIPHCVSLVIVRCVGTSRLVLIRSGPMCG